MRCDATQFESVNASSGWIFYMSVIIFMNAVFSSLFLTECILKIIAFGPRVRARPDPAPAPTGPGDRTRTLHVFDHEHCPGVLWQSTIDPSVSVAIDDLPNPRLLINAFPVHLFLLFRIVSRHQMHL